MLVLISSASLEGRLAVLSGFISTHAFVFDQPSIRIGCILGFFIASLGEMLVFLRSLSACVSIYILDIFIHMKYICILFRYVFYSNLNGSPKPVSFPSWLFGSCPGQEQCGYPLADAFNGWYQSPQESMGLWIRYFDLKIEVEKNQPKYLKAVPRQQHHSQSIWYSLQQQGVSKENAVNIRNPY